MGRIRAAYAADLEIRSVEASAAAEVAAAVYRVNGAKGLTARAFNPAATALHRIRAQETVSARTARIMLELLDGDGLPGWVAGAVDRELLEAAKG